MKISYSQHVPSRIFYAFKSGYELYANLFAEGIINAIENDSRFRTLKFNYIINIPLSPDKIENGELDRVDSICTKLSKMLGVSYLRNALILSSPISRRVYRWRSQNVKFDNDYYEKLVWKIDLSLDNKIILIVDDVVTDGRTLKTFARKIHSRYPRAILYAATGGIMAKKRNMTWQTIRQYQFKR